MNARPVRPVRAAALAALVVFALGGCATSAPPPVFVPAPAQPAPSKPVAPPAAPVTPPAVPASPAPAATSGPRRFVPADSLPSRDALAVLGTIPEPLGVVPPPAPARATTPVPKPVAPAPVTPPPAVTPAPESSATKPATPPVVPAPVTPPVSRVTTPKPAASPPASGAVVLPLEPVPPPPPPPPPDTCWRVQFAAPTERVKAEAVRDAAQSLLVAPMAIELEEGRWKVRTRDCQSRAAAVAMKQRALDTGLNGAFLVRVPPR